MVLSQTAFISSAASVQTRQTANPECCRHCAHCHSACCVTHDSSDTARSVPIIPANGGSQLQWHLVPAAGVCLFNAAPAPSPSISSPHFLAASVDAPVYERNCSYLI